MQPPRFALSVGLLALAIACHSPTSPTDGKQSSSSAEHGRLSGAVTIGPNCPGPQDSRPCPTQPSAYAARKILIYDEAKSALLFTVDIDSQGAYVIDLAPAKYTVDLKPNGADRTSDLPKVIGVTPSGIIRLDVSIDTGLR
jgi:hypothetical protein